MIQRIQTVFLALAALSGFALFLQPMDFALLNGVSANSTMLADGIFDINDHVIFMVLAGLAGLIPLISIFLFKNRKLQMKLDTAAVFLVGVFVGIAGFFFYKEFEPIQDTAQATIGAGIASPVLSFVFLLLANKFIKKDEKLVRSADRLR